MVEDLAHEGNKVREFYAALESPVVVGIEATGAMQWFLELLEELGVECRVGHPAKIRAAETRKQKHDRRDARLELKLLVEDRFPTIWMPSSEQRDLRTLLWDRHQWVKMRSRLQHTLQAIALNHALRRGRTLGSPVGQKALRALPLAPYTSQRRNEPLSLYTQEGMGKARVAAARKLGIRLWIMLRDHIDYAEFCRRGQQRQYGEAHVGMPDYTSGPALQ
jgi:transposase